MSHLMADGATRDKPLSCQFCNKSFGRSEHLKRHILTHTRSREYQCRVCRKAFFRKDALSRHEQTHQTTGPSLLQRGGRACIPCASSKTRCSGQATCARCQQRSLQCTYPEASSPNESMAQQAEISTHVAQGTTVIENESRSGGLIEHAYDQTSYITQQAPQDTLPYEMAPISHGDTQTDISTTQFHTPTRIMMDGSNHFQQSNSTTEMYQALPVNYSTVNWLGFGDGSGLTASLDQDWQYSDHLFDFYMPASDTRSISQVSPAASRELEIAISAPLALPNQTESTPRDTGTTSTFDTDETTTPGQYYADGGTARLPRMRKRKRMSSYVIHEHAKRRFSLLPPAESSYPPSSNDWIDSQGYAELQSHYSSLCTPSASIFAPFESIEFPPKSLFHYLCDLYLENCHAILPFLHIPTLRLRKQHPVLVSCMAAVGSHYLKDQSVNRFVLSMHEFIRRILLFAAESQDVFQMNDATRYQVTLLHTVGAIYCGDEGLKDHALTLRLSLANFFLYENGSRVMTIETEKNWHDWAEQESYLRLRHCTLLLDCVWSFQFQTRMMLSLSDARLALPVDEDSWNAATASQWTQVMGSREKTLQLAFCVDELYTSKRIMANTGEFARILLIYGLHRRLYEVTSYQSQRLSHWASKDQVVPEMAPIPDRPIWLPSVPVFRQWQNLTCDSLDVLHWAANATIGEASGFEHPTVLHLHLARVILLTPIREIVNLARYLAGERGAKSEADVMVDRQAVHRWALQHQYKARLAAVHAGVVFWHVRRFSANAFYEPTAVAHAALVLWAFSAFSSKTASPPGLLSDANGHSISANTDVETECNTSDSESSSDTIILLDRPADDEIVQEFVLHGPRMRANMTGVGDLYGEKGPERVVREGSKILKTLGCWRVWESWARVLDRLMVVCKRERKRVKDVAVAENHATLAS